jgi:diguanylate cyclase (GGDEF)-like protein
MISGKKALVERGLLKERHIPGLIMWVPILSILITAITISLLFIASFHNLLEVESVNLEESLLNEGRTQIKEEVNEVLNYIEFNRLNSEKLLNDELKNRIDIAYSIMESIYAYNHSSKSDEEIIDIIRETLRDVRFFVGRGYFFIHRFDLDSKDFTILQPNMPSLEGDHQLDDKDFDGKLISESSYNILAAKGEGFLSFNFYLDDQNKKEKKLAYVKLFKPLNIFIGAGDYLNYFEEGIKKDVLLWLKNYKYRNDNYIFVYDKTGTILMHPISPELAGQNVGGFRDSNGYNFGKEYMKASGTNSGIYVSYDWLDPGSKTEGTKIGYAQSYKDWNWNIATGIYMASLQKTVIERQNNLSERVKLATLRTILIVGILILAVFIITLIFARFTASLFSIYNQHILESSEYLKDFNLALENKVKEKTTELEKKNIELEQIATTDGLCGIYNRRYFDSILNKEWYRHMRNNSTISLIMCDIDYFKQYNDTYGHQGGDECLQIVAGILKKICKRPVDIAARYGGEEFALILPQTDKDGALKIASDIQAEISNQKIRHASSFISDILTISFGVSSIVPEHGDEYSLLIKSADKALYKAKANGRNRIEFQDTCN